MDYKEWLEYLNLYIEYLQTEKKVPVTSSELMYKNKPLGDWVHRQTDLQRKGNLPNLLKSLLDNICPVWNGTRAEKKAFNMELLINSDWKKNVDDESTAIDMAVSDAESLYFCLSNKIYTCEELIKQKNDKKIALKMKAIDWYKVYAAMIPRISPRYMHLLCDANEITGFASVEELNEFINDYSFLSRDDMERQIDSLLDNLPDRRRDIIACRYGLNGKIVEKYHGRFSYNIMKKYGLKSNYEYKSIKFLCELFDLSHTTISEELKKGLWRISNRISTRKLKYNDMGTGYYLLDDLPYKTINKLRRFGVESLTQLMNILLFSEANNVINSFDSDDIEHIEAFKKMALVVSFEEFNDLNLFKQKMIENEHPNQKIICFGNGEKIEYAVYKEWLFEFLEKADNVKCDRNVREFLSRLELESYDQDQIEEILLGINDDLDIEQIELYVDKSYSAERMNWIRTIVKEDLYSDLIEIAQNTNVNTSLLYGLVYRERSRSDYYRKSRKAEFMDENIVFLLSIDSVHFYTYDEVMMVGQRRSDFRFGVYLRSQAEEMGYIPC